MGKNCEKLTGKKLRKIQKQFKQSRYQKVEEKSKMFKNVQKNKKLEKITQH